VDQLNPFGPLGYEESPPDGVEAFYAAIRDLVETIPAGRVMAYGAVAAAIGSRAARAVGRYMAQSGGSLPWWRVVYADGHILPGYETAALDRYREEGTPLLTTPTGWRIDMRRASWSPYSD